MARFWQRYDVDDPKTSESLAQLVEDPETLHYLYVLTYCDARGTTEELWNSYKDALHTHLYQNTLAHLQDRQVHYETQAMITPVQIQHRLPQIPQEEIEAHFNLLPERYFKYNSETDILLHLRMVNELLRNIAEADSLGSLVPIVEWQDDVNLDLTVVHVVTWDRAGLFYKLAGAFSLAGLSIVSSKALSRADHITIDTFYVGEPGGGIIQEKSIFRAFTEHLKYALLYNRDLMPSIRDKSRKLSRRDSLLYESDPSEAVPVQSRVDVYHELSLRRTIIEIEAQDQIGLLYRVARVIFEHGYDITFARIATEKFVAVDTFYIEPVPGSAPNQESDSLIRLRAALQTAIESSDF